MSRILIAGGGIGALAAALALARGGHQVRVFERQERFTELGAGIQIAPNGFLALDRLGVGEQVRRRAVYVDELRFMDGATGRLVQSMPLGDPYRARFGNPYAVVHRIDLYAPILEACRQSPDIILSAGRAVAGYRRHADGAALLLADGTEILGDAVIGADGIRSAVRRTMLADGDPRVSGHTIYRSVIPMNLVPERLRSNCVTLWAGPSWHFVHYPIGGGDQLNLAATRDDGATEPVSGKPVPRELVSTLFSDISGQAAALLELGREWREWVLCDREPVRRWTDGPVVLLGDAAHPMLQYAAQGACMALEDAVILGELTAGVEGATDLAASFARFEAERRERTAAATLTAREMGRALYHPRGTAAQERNAMLGAFTADDLYDKVSWLHAWSPRRSHATGAAR